MDYVIRKNQTIWKGFNSYTICQIFGTMVEIKEIFGRYDICHIIDIPNRYKLRSPWITL